MAIQTVTRHSCDRCNKVYEENAPTPESQKPKVTKPAALVIEFDQPATEATGPFRSTLKFEDLCPKCSARVADLIGAIKLETRDGKGGGADSESSTKPLDPKDKPSDNKTKTETKASDAKVS